jgi:hypothetical protein
MFQISLSVQLCLERRKRFDEGESFKALLNDQDAKWKTGAMKVEGALETTEDSLVRRA